MKGIICFFKGHIQMKMWPFLCERCYQPCEKADSVSTTIMRDEDQDK